MTEHTGHADTLWVCVDCHEAHHGLGEERDDYTPDREPLSLISDEDEVTAGLLWEEHAEDCPNRIEHDLGAGYVDATECECERQTFSWSPCQGCGSALGGAREALTVWSRVSGEVVLRETTHHGDYYHQRDVTLPRAFTGEDVARMAQECPYVYVLSPERAQALADALNTYNKAEHGWTTWEVVSVNC